MYTLTLTGIQCKLDMEYGYPVFHKVYARHLTFDSIDKLDNFRKAIDLTKDRYGYTDKYNYGHKLTAIPTSTFNEWFQTSVTSTDSDVFTVFVTISNNAFDCALEYEL